MHLTRNMYFRGAWPAQLVERETLDLGAVRSSPMVDVELT